MKLQGLHHITMITGDARRNVEFYGDVLGLRLVNKTVKRDELERTLTPLVDPRTARREKVGA
jgi:catechol 2,3-dioxygenase-like lactoylglutathione lyase family enzyme